MHLFAKSLSFSTVFTHFSFVAIGNLGQYRGNERVSDAGEGVGEAVIGVYIDYGMA